MSQKSSLPQLAKSVSMVLIPDSSDEGVPTPSGEGTWTAATVARLRHRLALS